jgi:hypothetical protein
MSSDQEIKAVKEKWQTENNIIQREGSHQLVQLVLQSGPIANNAAYALLRQKGFLNPSPSIFEPCLEGVCHK